MNSLLCLRGRAFAPVCLILLLCPGITSAADAIADAENLLPDFYSDPSISTSSGYFGGSGLVTVDPFSGMASVSNTDIVIPGDGGFDIRLTRTYHSLDPWAEPEHSPLGLGWSMHFGYVEIANPDKMCDLTYNAYTADNPVYVGPDGSSHVLALTHRYPASAPRIPTYSAGNYSVMFCETDGSFYMMSSEGMRYDFGYRHVARRSATRWMVTRVTDPNGNMVDVTYADAGSYGSQGKVISTVQASDGRTLTFNYDNLSSESVSLASITTPVGNWTFLYQPANLGLYPGLSHLVEVENPVGLRWSYTYWPYQNDGSSGSGSLRTVTNPHGAREELAYSKVRFDNRAESRESSVVVSHTKYANPGTLGTWTYGYSPTSTEDVTVITGPDGVRTFRHYGYMEAVNGQAWRIGTLKSVTFEPSTGPTRTEEYVWEPNELSLEDYIRTRDFGLGYLGAEDASYSVPRLKKKTIMVDGAVFTTETTAWWAEDGCVPPLPMVQLESTSSASFSGSREVKNDYVELPGKWIWGLPGNTWFDDEAPRESRFYDASGNLVQHWVKGFSTFYTYDSSGNVASEWQEDKPATTYSDYKAGVARRIDYPDGSFIERTVNNLGLVTSQTDALGQTTSYVYDDVGRILSVVPPIGPVSSVTWTTNSMILSRGGYSRFVAFDGRGRETLTRHSGVAGLTIELSSTYDHADRVLSQRLDNPGGASYETRYTWDEHGRQLSVTHPGGSRSYAYQNTRLTLTDERQRVTISDYKSFGDLSLQFLIGLTQDDADPLAIDVSNAGDVLSVAQGGITRTYTWYPYHQLESVSEPETGIEKYTWSASGNLVLVEKTDSLTAPSYSYWKLNEYDDMNRLVRVQDGQEWTSDDISTGTTTKRTWEETFAYDLLGRVKTATRKEHQNIYNLGGSETEPVFTLDLPVTWTYEYDALGAVTAASLAVGSRVFGISYEYDANHNLSAMVYPSGERVAYAPNAYGWATTAGRFASDISYHFNGTVASLSFGNGDIYSADLDSRLMLDRFTVSNGGTLLSRDYHYDPVGNITAINDLVDIEKSQSFAYDGTGRLVQASGVWGADSYDYDGIGNILSSTRNGVVATYSYDFNNRLSGLSGRISRSYTYGAAGQVVKSGAQSFSRNVDNKVWKYSIEGQASPAYLSYDANGWRVKAQQGQDRKQYFMYDQAGKLVYQLNEADDWYKEYYQVAGKSIATRRIDLECTDDFDADGVPHCKERDWNADPYNPVDGGQDGDGDGLTNVQEYQAGTNGTLSDSDYDGMPDGYEVGNGLNPNGDDRWEDKDGDGFSNIEEYENGTDPNQPDPPARITMLYAVAGDGVTAATWSPSSLADAYRLYYSDSPITHTQGLPYFAIQGEEAYIDTSVLNGMPRYYVVTALNEFGESALSDVKKSVPGTREWWTVNADRIDFQQNAYRFSNESKEISMRVFPGDGSTPFDTTVYKSPDKTLQLKKFEVGPAGHAVALWFEAANDDYLYASFYDPEKRVWQEKQEFSYNGSARELDISINRTGTAAFSMQGFRPINGVWIYYPEVVIRSNDPSSPKYWYSYSIDRGNTTRNIGSPGTSIDVADNGHIAVAWQGGDSDTLEEVVWASVLKPGGWIPVVVARESDPCCSNVAWDYVEPEVQLNELGQAVVRLTNNINAHAYYNGTEWFTSVGGGAEYDLGVQDIIVRILGGKSALEASMGQTTASGIQWDAVTAVGGRRSIAIQATAPEEYGSTRIFWLDDGGLTRQSVWTGSIWQDEVAAGISPVSRAMTMRPDIAGNLYTWDAGQAMGYAPRKAASYSAYVAVWNEAPDTPVREGDTAYLHGEFEDLDSQVSYEWVQLAGPQVQAESWTSLEFRPVTPQVDVDTDLVFALRVTAEDGAVVESPITITVQDRGPAPVVDAGPDFSVNELEETSIAATVTDEDNNISTYNWSVVSGPTTYLYGWGTKTVRFTAPSVVGDSELVLKFSATDKNGNISSDTVTVTIVDLDPPPPDNTPPTTTFTYSTSSAKGSVNYDMGFTTDEPATVYFRVIGTYDSISGANASTTEAGWLEPTGTVTLTKPSKGSITIEYWARDAAGNASAIQSSGAI